MQQLVYRIRLLSALHAGTGTTGTGLDDLVMRHPDGYPMIAAATMKGAVRDSIVRMRDRAGQESRANTDARIGAVFGGGDRDAGSVWFSDARPRDPSGVVVGIRNRVSLTPNRTAKPGALVSIEVVEPLVASGDGFVEFEGEVAPLPGTAAERASADLEFLAEGLARLRSLGSSTNRGYGRLQVALVIEGTKQ